MKLLSFEAGGEARVGAALPDRIIDLTRALAATHPEVRCADSMLGIIRSGIDIDAIGGECIRRLAAEGTLGRYAVENPKWLAPIARPPKILALALNSRAHLEESRLSFFDEPIVFEKYACNLVPHEGEIEMPPFEQVVEEEHELALVVGRDCRHLSPSQARDYIFGYTICNDVSARDRQRERIKMGQPYSYAKNFATFCPMGPWIVTAAELRDPSNLRVEVRVNGEVRRSGTTADMIFNPFEVLAYCSDYTPMEAGDIISLGTYGGRKRIAAGDVIEMETEGIGVLRNRVVKARAPWRNFTMDKPTGPFIRQTR